MVAQYWNPNQLLGYFTQKKVKGSEMKKEGKNNREHVNKNVVIPSLGWITF
jgi:hypothetical protein